MAETPQQRIQRLRQETKSGAQPTQGQATAEDPRQRIERLRAEKRGIQETPQDSKNIFGQVAGFLAPTTTGLVTGEQEVTPRALGGAALELGSFLIPGGAVARGAGIAARGLSLGQKVRSAAKLGAGAGATFEAGQAVADPEAGLGEIAGRAVRGGLVGGTIGGAIPVAGAGISGARRGLAARRAERAERADLLQRGEPDSRVVSERLEGGRIVGDPQARRALSVGVPEDAVILSKNASKKDASDMLEMVNIREKQLTNPRLRATDRSNRVVGKTFIDRVQFIAKKNKEAGQELGRVAERLAGKKVNVEAPLDEFADQLSAAGVKFDAKGKITKSGFQDSVFDFPGGKSTQQTIRETWARAQRLAKSRDALAAHRMKTAIDAAVDYGRTEGLAGKAQNVLKGFRRSLDQALDSKFDDYNRANELFAQTRRQLDEVASAMGRKFNIGDEFADLNAARVIGRIDSNARSGVEIMQLLNDLEKNVRALGLDAKEDLVSQALFDARLNKIFGDEGGSTFASKIQQAIEKTSAAAQVGEGLARGGIVGGATRAAQAGAEILRGANKENQIKALKELLKRGSNFGK